MKVFIACPTLFTGGPTLAHQFCYMLRKNNIDVYMYYYNRDGYFTCEWDLKGTGYEHFRNPVAMSHVEADMIGNVMILPETAVWLKEDFKKAEIVIWWMSVDNYLWKIHKHPEWLESDIVFFLENRLHLVQSQYAYRFCLDTLKIENRNILWLTDYVDDTFQNSVDLSDVNRENIVFYNKAKCSGDQKYIMELHPEIEWIPISGMKPAEVAAIFRCGKVYVDFGDHPGKDRMPREAAASGLCVITNKKGSAAYYEDIPISEKYKFPSPKESIEDVIGLIYQCFENYNSIIQDFEHYRKMIKKEKCNFCGEISLFADRLGELLQNKSTDI